MEYIKVSDKNTGNESAAVNPMDTQKNETATTSMNGGSEPETESTSGVPCSEEGDDICLISRENEEFYLLKEAAMISPAISNSLRKDGCCRIKIKIRSEVLGIIVRFLTAKYDFQQGLPVDKEFKIEKEIALEVLCAACYLKC